MGDDLYKLLKEAIAKRIDKDDFITQFREALKKGGAKLEDAHEYAQRRGEASSGALLDIIQSGVLPNDRMDFDTASHTVRPLLEENFNDVQDAANQVQKVLDRAQGIGLNGVNADFPEERAAGLIDKLTHSETVEETRQWLGEPVILFSLAAFDRWVQTNAEFRERSGMKTQIVRTAHSGACAWCRALAKVYDYGRDVIEAGNTDVFRRHKYCRCTVVFESGKMRQNVWNKRMWQASPAELATRKLTGRNISVLSPEIAEEFNALSERDRKVDEEIRRYKEWQKKHPDARSAYRNIDRRMARDRVNRSLKRAEEDAKIASTIAGKLSRSPTMLGTMSPKEIKDALEKAGFDVKPLGRGSLKGISFEEGGGFKVNFGGTGLIQYHPSEKSHHGGAYYKISTGEGGTHRYDLNGNEKK